QFKVDATKTSNYRLGPESSSVKHPSETNDYSQQGDYELQRDEKVKIHMFTDGSVIEVFVNDKDAFTATILPSDEESTMIDLFATGGTALVEEIEIYRLKSSKNTVQW